MKYLLGLLIICATAYFAVETLRLVPIAPGGDCYSSASGGLRLGWLDSKDVRLDRNCVGVESTRMFQELGMEARALFAACSLEGSRQAFGSVENCLDYGGNFQQAIDDRAAIEAYCKQRSKKWYRKLTFQTKRKYQACLQERL